MVLSLDADLKSKVDQGSSKPVWLVELHPRPYKLTYVGTHPPVWTPNWSDSDVNTYPIRFCYSDRPLVIQLPYTGSEDEYGPIRDQSLIPNIIQSITPLSAELGPIERDVTQEDITLEIIDEGTIRNILDDPGIGVIPFATTDPNLPTFLLGQKVVIKLGFQSLDISKFLQLGVYSIEEVTPTEGIIELSCKSITSIPHTVKVTRNFRARSPHGQIHELLYNEIGLNNASGTYDEDSVDAWYSDAQPSNDIGKRHWACRREDVDIDGDFHVTETAAKDENAWDLLSTLSYQTGGCVIERESGKITYVPYVASAAAVRDLTSDDIDQFSQEMTYSNTQNKVSLSMQSTAGTTEYTGTDRVTGTSSKSGAFFGGLDADIIFSVESKEAASATRWPDRPTELPEIDNCRWREYEQGLPWQSPISNIAFLEARLVTWGDMAPYAGTYPMTNIAGSTQGAAASYNHATREVTLASGFLNITSHPGGPFPLSPSWPPGMIGFRLSDFVDVTRGPVFRITSIGDGEPIYDASGNHISFKEGRIESIDNSGASSVITLADDFLLEFEDDWGFSVSGHNLNWVILEPSYPVNLDPSLPLPNYGTRYGSVVSSAATIQAAPWTRNIAGSGPLGTNPLLPTGALGVRCLPDPSGTTNITQFNSGYPSGLYQSRNPCKFAVHFSRYFYVQWAGISGFSGSNVQFTGHAGLTGSPHNAPFLETLDPNRMGGPACGGVGNQGAAGPGQGLPGGTGFPDLRLLYGHESSAPYAQLQGYERTQALAIENDKERYAYLKFEMQTRNPGSSRHVSWHQQEFVKCNAAYPIPRHWISYYGIGTVFDWTRAYTTVSHPVPAVNTSDEPPIKLTPAPRESTGARHPSEVTSTFVYRVDCKTQTIGFDYAAMGASGVQLSIVPAFGALSSGATVYDRVIIPSGRGQLGTVPQAMIQPDNILSYGWVNHVRTLSNADFTASIDTHYELHNTAPLTVKLPSASAITVGQRVLIETTSFTSNRTSQTITVEADDMDAIDGVPGTDYIVYIESSSVEITTNASHVFKWVGGSGPTAIGWQRQESKQPNATESHYLGALASDVSVPKSTAERILNRLAEGMPIVSFTTSLKHLDLQIGEFVSITHPLYLRHAQNGSNSETIFEITRKEVDIEADTPRINWSAAWVRQGEVTTWKYTRPPGLPPSNPGITTGKPPNVEIYTDEGTIVTDESGFEIKQVPKYPGVGPAWVDGGEDYDYAGWESEED